MLVLRRAGDAREHKVGLETSLLGSWVVRESIVVDNAEIVLPREALHLLVKAWAQ
jgi:hypothetical protein